MKPLKNIAMITDQRAKRKRPIQMRARRVPRDAPDMSQASVPMMPADARAKGQK